MPVRKIKDFRQKIIELTMARRVPRSLLVEFSSLLNLEHQITTIHILHHKKQPILKQKNRTKINEALNSHNASLHLGVK